MMSCHHELVNALFASVEADDICAIPISRLDSPDTLVWSAHNKGRDCPSVTATWTHLGFNWEMVLEEDSSMLDWLDEVSRI
ncbi:hypothetical protein REPUB_Repub17cG0040500 [Reevesia pubescens]